MRESLVVIARRAWAAHELDARCAFEEYAAMCGGHPPPRVPGMDTSIRLAIRIAVGRTISEAAGREYFYRWNLALRSPRAFGVPHTLGL